MCGIAGKIDSRGRVEQELVDRMCEVIEHRGPDSRGTFVDRGVGLGVQRLRVIDLRTGDQPIFNEDRSVVLVFNGEIYNYRELREDLTSRGHRFETGGDTETIVHLYEEYGRDCARHLRGMFAFALWDTRRRRLLLARDRVGKKPLFYAEQDGAFWFGSEAKSILQDETVERRIDARAIDAYLHYQYVPHPQSAFDALRKLPPAHTLVWEGDRASVERYWRLSYGDQFDLPEGELHELIRSQILEATRIGMRSDVPLGAFLSGGVDSSAVVAAMAQQSAEPVKTFSIGFDVASYDETPYAREVATLYGTDHHELRVEPHAIEVLPRLVWHYGEPFADHSAIPSFYLAELTRQHVTVALNGDGGDESFAGYTRYVGNGLAGRVGALPLPLRAAAHAVGAVAGRGRNVSSFRSRVSRATSTALMTPWDRYATWVAYFNENDRRELYTPEFAAVVDGADPHAVVREPWLASDAPDLVNRLLDVDVQTYLPGDLLVKMDIASMAHSLEVRSPLLDHVLMETAARIPARFKVRGRETKVILKDAVRPWLPDRLLDRPKWGFGVPIGHWFRGELRDLPAEILLDARSVDRGMFRPPYVRRLIDEHTRGTRDHADRLWALIQLELWQRMFVDAPRPQLAAVTV